MSFTCTPIKGTSHVDIIVNNKKYSILLWNYWKTSVKMYFIFKSCTLLSLSYTVKQAELRINILETKICSMTASSLMVPHLFANLKSQVWPIVTKPCASNDSNQFIAQVFEHFLAEGIIEPCSSLWRAQVVIVKNI